MFRPFAAAVAATLMTTSAALAQASVPADGDIARILVERIDQQQGVGLAVAIVTPDSVRYVFRGTTGGDTPGPLTAETIFEIGSITKIFTSLLLADAVVSGTARLDQPVEELLPDGWSVPVRSDRQITLQDLATQMSGLPRLPDNMAPAEPSDPYADYSADDLRQFLASHQLQYDSGARYEYSNLGFGLLGYALGEQAGSDFASLVADRIATPLALTDTTTALSAEQRARFITGYDQELAPVSPWTFDALAGAGALRSTPADMARFIQAAMADEGPLAEAFALMLAQPRTVQQSPMQIGLGWMIVPTATDEIVWHNGGTGGFRSFAGYLRKAKVGVIVLGNAATELGVDDIGMHLLNPGSRLLQPPVKRSAVTVSAEQLDAIVGTYALAPEFAITIRRDGEQVFAQATGQAEAEIFAESATSYFYKVVDAQLEFTIGEDGRASQLVLRQNGQTIQGARSN